MTAQTAARMQRVERFPVANPIFQIANIKTIRPIQKSELPMSRYRGRVSTMRNLEVVKDFDALLDHINKNNINPSEVAGEIVLDSPEIERERAGRKCFNQSFRKFLRQQVKEHGLADYIDVKTFDHDKRIFVVGKAA
jgi:hypothetical protein